MSVVMRVRWRGVLVDIRPVTSAVITTASDQEDEGYAHEASQQRERRHTTTISRVDKRWRARRQKFTPRPPWDSPSSRAVQRKTQHAEQQRHTLCRL